MQLKENSTVTENYLQKLLLHFTHEKRSVLFLISVFSMFSICLKTTFSVFCTHQWVFCNSHNGGEEDYGDKSLNVIIQMKYRVY